MLFSVYLVLLRLYSKIKTSEMCLLSLGMLLVPHMPDVLMEGREIKEIYQNQLAALAI